jgi:hypothetical protein
METFSLLFFVDIPNLEDSPHWQLYCRQLALDSHGPKIYSKRASVTGCGNQIAVKSKDCNEWVWMVESSWNVMAHGNARDGKWRGNWRMEWVASTLHTTSEHVVSNITTADAHTSAASSRLNWRPRRFKWTRPFRRKTKSVFCMCAITFQTQSTCTFLQVPLIMFDIGPSQFVLRGEPSQPCAPTATAVSSASRRCDSWGGFSVL